MYAQFTRPQSSPNASSQLMMHYQEPFAYGREGPVEVLRYFWLDNMKLAHYSSLSTTKDTAYHQFIGKSRATRISISQPIFLTGPSDRRTTRPSAHNSSPDISDRTFWLSSSGETSNLQIIKGQESVWQVQNLLVHQRAHHPPLQSISPIPSKIIEHRLVDYQIQNGDIRPHRRRRVEIRKLDQTVTGR